MKNPYRKIAGIIGLDNLPNKMAGSLSIKGGSALPVPVNTVAPVISGDNVVGATLTSTTGTWDNTPTSYTYQWRRAGVDIGGATASTYVVVPADENKPITCFVIASNASGPGVGATSNTITIQDQNAIALIAALEAQGATFTNAKKTAIDRKFKDWKGVANLSYTTYDIYSKIHHHHFFVTTVANADRLNWVNPVDSDAANRLVWHGAWDYTSGAKGNAINTFAETFFIPSTDTSLNNSRESVLILSNTATSNERDMGSFNAGTTAAYNIGVNKTDDSIFDHGAFPGNRITIPVTPNAMGQWSNVRSANNVHSVFLNGVSQGVDTTVNAATLPAVQVYVGAVNLDLVGAVGITSKNYAGCADTEALTAPQELSEYLSNQALLTAFGMTI